MQSIRILCIEDDPDLVGLYRSRFPEERFSFTTVPDGESGLAICYAEQYDVVLIDYTLPGMSGLHVIHELVRVNPNPPAMIMITGTGDEHVAVEAFKAGVSDYVVKDLKGVYLHLLPVIVDQIIAKQTLDREQQQLVEQQSQLIEHLESFSFAVAHDLKQPLAVLLNSLYLIRRYNEAGMHDNIEAKVDQLQETVLKMNETLDALIMFARVERSDDFALHPLDMTQILGSTLLHMRDVIEASGAQITVKGELPISMGYAPWLESVWRNYLSNAIKYGGVPPVIEVGGEAQADGMVRYYVRDNGEGISKEDQERIFLPFTRLRERKAKGYGLGLAIVSMIIRKLGGEVGVTSTPGKEGVDGGASSSGGGSVFSFALPEAINT